MSSTALSNGHDDLKARLIELRDSPVEDPDSNLMLNAFNWAMGRPQQPDGLHWFCHRADETLVMASTFLMRIFAYESTKKVQWLQKLENYGYVVGTSSR